MKMSIMFYGHTVRIDPRDVSSSFSDDQSVSDEAIEAACQKAIAADLPRL